MRNPYQQYMQNSIDTMTKGELLVQLFDGAIKKLTLAKVMLEQSKPDEAVVHLNKTRDIFNYLMVTLDESYEISSQLNELYMFINGEIIKAAAMRDKSIIESVLPLVRDMRDTWAEADKLAKIKK